MQHVLQKLADEIAFSHARISALENFLTLLIAAEADKNPSLMKGLKRMAAGDIPKSIPDLNGQTLTEEQKVAILANAEKGQRAIRDCTVEFANRIAGFLASKPTE